LRFKITRELRAQGVNKELLLEVDEELLNIYRAEMEIDDFDQESFSKWLEMLVQYSSDGENWKYD
jgi:hypothetical protein